MEETIKDAKPSIEVRKSSINGSENEVEFEDDTSEKSWKHQYVKNPFIEYHNIKIEEEEEELYKSDEDELALIEQRKRDEEREKLISSKERKELLEKLNLLYSESNFLLIKNKFLHKKYISLIRKSPIAGKALDKFDDVLVFEDIRYQQALDNYDETKINIEEKKKRLLEGYENLKKNYDIIENKYKNTFEDLINRMIVVAKKIVPLKMSKQTWLDEVNRLLDIQRRRMMDVTKIRLNYIRLHHRLETLQHKVRKFNNFGPEFSIMDYEVLTKRKTVFTDKRDEQLESIKKYKINNLMVAGVIKHYDEELDLYRGIIKNKYKNLKVSIKDNEASYYKNIEIIKRRGVIFKNILKLKEELCLLDNTFLIKKMESDINQIEKLKNQASIIQAKILKDEKKEKKNYKDKFHKLHNYNLKI